MEALTRYLDHRISGSPDSVAPSRNLLQGLFGGLFLRDLRVLNAGVLAVCAARGDAAAALSFRLHLHPAAHGQRQSDGCRRAAWTSAPSFCRDWMAVAIMFSGIAGVALPLSSRIRHHARIDDRVMCPLPLWTVALEKRSGLLQRHGKA